jgi:hypothetical protein
MVPYDVTTSDGVTLEDVTSLIPVLIDVIYFNKVRIASCLSVDERGHEDVPQRRS